MSVTVFGDGAVQTAYVSFTALDITNNSLTLVWPTSYFNVPSEVGTTHYDVLAASMTVTDGLANINTITLPDATESSVGSNFIITNIGASSFKLLKSDGSQLIVVPIASTPGINLKTACLVVQAANLTAVYNNGAAGVGATLTNSGTLAALVVDGVTVPLNSRVLVIGQTSAFQNGIYTCTDQGSGVAAWVLTRSTDYNTPAQIMPGDVVPISGGVQYGGSYWLQTSTVNTIGTDPITFFRYPNSPNPGNSFWVQLTNNSTPAGEWQFVQFGAGTSQAQASALAGNGLVALSNLLNTNIAVQPISSAPYNVSVPDRAKLFLWQTGMGQINLPPIVNAPDGFYISVNNEGSGLLTIATNAADLPVTYIDKNPFTTPLPTLNTSIEIAPTQSLSIISDGSNWWTLGFGQNITSSKFIPGSVIAPSITFTIDPTTGIYYYQTAFPPVTPPGIGFSVGSVPVANLTKTGLYLNGGTLANPATLIIQDPTNVSTANLSANAAYAQLSFDNGSSPPATLNISGTNTGTTMTLGPFGTLSISQSLVNATLTYHGNIIFNIDYTTGLLILSKGVEFTNAVTFSNTSTVDFDNTVTFSNTSNTIVNGPITFNNTVTVTGVSIFGNTATFNGPAAFTNTVSSVVPWPITSGGTGQSTQQTALNALMPPTPAIGDLLYYDATNNWVRLPVGAATAGQVLTLVNMSGNLVPQWQPLPP